MNSLLRDWASRRFFLWSIIFFLIACVIPAKGRFVINYGGQQKIISSHEYPLLYWGTELLVLVVALSLCAFGLYRSRGKGKRDQ